ncbi:MAG TPA: bifunctional riboflavin kinase/FAD synthetase [Actinobacteria bacterium]|jgi:riboflavin kinase/FMN adenylyltransferase|nr:bifunctional riboflavin kinase/FAD synthetase [Actinomycetota bacterium]
MEVVRGVGSLPLGLGPAAVTVGVFDGVHRGHQAVVRRTVAAANERGLTPVAVTFDRHPREVLTPGDAPRLLTTLERKAELIAALGVTTLVVLEFTPEVAAWAPEDFARRILAEGLQARHVVVGENFTFGHKARGNLATLTSLGDRHGFKAEGVTVLSAGARPVSSSSIREALAAGELDWPAEALGRRFAVDGTVVRGAGRGGGLGWPTANLEVPARMLIPGEGVYAGRTVSSAGAHVAAINVGTNPTFGGEPLHIEAYLLDFDGDLRDGALSVEFWARLRDEVRFGSPQELSRQIGEDVRRTRELVAERNPS